MFRVVLFIVMLGLATYLPISLNAADAPSTTPEQAVDNLAQALAVDADMTPEQYRDRGIKIREWWKWYEAEKPDLGEDSYASAFARYFSGDRTGAAAQLKDYLVEHDSFPAPPEPFRMFLDRLLPQSAGLAMHAEDYPLLIRMMPALVEFSSNPYALYTFLGTDLHNREKHEAIVALVELIGMAMKDARLSAVDKDNLLRLIYATGSSGEIPFLNFSGPGLDGTTLSVDDFKGKILLVEFWATWCIPCLKEMPHVVEAYEDHKDRGFEILGVTLDDEEQAENIHKAMKKYGMDWPQIYEGKGLQTKPAAMNNVQSIPANFLLDRQGKTRFQNLRGDELSEKIEELLNEPDEQPEASPEKPAAPKSEPRAVPRGR